MKGLYRWKIGLGLLLVASSGGLYGLLQWTAVPIEYAFPDRRAPAGGPFECRLVLIERPTRVAWALQGYLFPPPANPDGSQEGNVFPPLNNPLVLNEMSALCARVEARNVSGQDVVVQADGAAAGSMPLPRLVGWVAADIKDEGGNEMCFHNYSRNGLKEIGATDPETGASVPWRFVQEPRPPILRLRSGQVLTYDFAILGPVDLDAALRPGRYTVRAVFHYRAPPEGKRAAGEVQAVRSEPITVQLTQDHIDEWRAWVNKRLSERR